MGSVNLKIVNSRKKVFLTHCKQLHKLNVYMLVRCRLCAVLHNDLKSGGNADLHLTTAPFSQLLRAIAGSKLKKKYIYIYTSHFVTNEMNSVISYIVITLADLSAVYIM